jgi:hypothetical protein
MGNDLARRSNAAGFDDFIAADAKDRPLVDNLAAENLGSLSAKQT